MTDTKPARKPLLDCPWCGIEPNVSERTLHGGPCWSIYCRNHCCEIAPAADFFDSESEAIAAWNRRITRPPAPAKAGELAEGIDLVRLLARQHRSAAATLTADGDEDADAHRRTAAQLDVVAAAAERAPTEAQMREIAEAWCGVYSLKLSGGTFRRMHAALRAAGIIGDEHG